VGSSYAASVTPPRVDAEASPEVLSAAGLWPFSAEAGTLTFRAVPRHFAWAFGYPLDAWRAPGFLARVLEPEEREAVLVRRAACACDGLPLDHEFRVLTAAGGRRWVREILEAHGADGIVHGAWLDVDERRCAEESLRTERWRLRSLLEGTNVGTWEWNVQTGETRFDERWAAIVGHTLAELEPTDIETWKRLAHPEDLQRSGAELARHFAGELAHYDVECRMRHRDGHWVWVQDRGRVITRTPDGQPEWMFGTNADVTERKRAEAELQRAHGLLSGLARLQREFLALLEPHARFDGLLRFLLEVTGSAYGFVGEVLHRPDGRPYVRTQALTNIAWSDATHALYAEAVAHGLEFGNLDTLFGHVLVSGKPVIANDPAHDPRRGGLPAGHPPLDAFLGLPLYVGGEQVGVVGLANRAGGYAAELVTELEPVLQTCASLVDSSRQLRQRRAAEAEQAALEERLREARHLESLGLLAGGLAHDFNNLLAGILGHGELARAELAPETPAAVHLDQAQLGVQRAAELVRQMLVYAGKARREPVQLDLAALCREVVRTLPSAHEVRLELEADLEPVSADAEQLRQCLRHLLQNASEALPTQGGALVVRVHRAAFGAPAPDEFEALPGPAQGPALALEIEDGGHGMDAALLARIFEPFFSTRFVGRGLGLCVVLGIARTHGGALRCRSLPGQGTRVTLLLPVSSAGPPVVRAVAVPRRATLAGATVLVVEDEEPVRAVVCRLLEHHGARPLAAASGAEALALHAAEAERIALVLLDCQMPGLDGIMVLHELARRSPPPCVVLTSGQDLDELRGELESGRAAGFLAKPFGSEALRETLEQALARWPQSSRSRPTGPRAGHPDRAGTR